MFGRSTFSIETKKPRRLCSYQGDLILSGKKIIRKILMQDLHSKTKFKFIFSNILNLSLMLTWSTLISFLLNENHLLYQESINKIFCILGISYVVLLSLSSELKNEYSSISEEAWPLVFYFQKKNEKNNFAKSIFENVVYSFIDSFYLFVIWNTYYKLNEMSFLMNTCFLINIINVSSFANFSINVLFIFNFYLNSE